MIRDIQGHVRTGGEAPQFYPDVAQRGGAARLAADPLAEGDSP